MLFRRQIQKSVFSRLFCTVTPAFWQPDKLFSWIFQDNVQWHIKNYKNERKKKKRFAKIYAYLYLRWSRFYLHSGKEYSTGVGGGVLRVRMSCKDYCFVATEDYWVVYWALVVYICFSPTSSFPTPHPSSILPCLCSFDCGKCQHSINSKIEHEQRQFFQLISCRNTIRHLHVANKCLLSSLLLLLSSLVCVGVCLCFLFLPYCHHYFPFRCNMTWKCFFQIQCFTKNWLPVVERDLKKQKCYKFWVLLRPQLQWQIKKWRNRHSIFLSILKMGFFKTT